LETSVLKTPTLVNLTLVTRDGRVGTCIVSDVEDANTKMVWTEEGDDETILARFECGDEAIELDGHEWREIEENEEVTLIPFWVSRGVSLNTAVFAAHDGCDPNGFSLDAKRYAERLELRIAALEGALVGMVQCFNLSDSPDHVDYQTWADAKALCGELIEP
jgi:hypothetical protein